MYYKVLVKEKGCNHSRILVVEARSESGAREKAIDYLREEWPSREFERLTISHEWIWDVIL